LYEQVTTPSKKALLWEQVQFLHRKVFNPVLIFLWFGNLVAIFNWTHLPSTMKLFAGILSALAIFYMMIPYLYHFLASLITMVKIVFSKPQRIEVLTVSQSSQSQEMAFRQMQSTTTNTSNSTSDNIVPTTMSSLLGLIYSDIKSNSFLYYTFMFVVITSVGIIPLTALLTAYQNLLKPSP